jgi:hypothetical protein
MSEAELTQIAVRALDPELELERVIVERDRVALATQASSSLESATRLTLIALCDGNAGVASLPADSNATALEEAVELAHERAEWKAEQNGLGPLGDALPQLEPRTHSAFDPATATADPGLLASLAQASAADHPGTTLELVAASLETLVTGPDCDPVHDRRTLARATATTVSAGRCSSASHSVSELDCELYARMAFMHGEFGIPAIVAEQLPAVLGSEALAAIIDFIAAEFVADNPSGIELGATIAAGLVTLSELPTLAGTLGRSLDSEGSRTSDTTLIKGGTAHALVGDLLATGGGTGNARSAFAIWDPPRPANLVLDAGLAEDERELAKADDCLLISAIESLARQADGTISASTSAAERKLGGEVIFVGPLEINLPRYGGLEAITELTARQDLHAFGKLASPREWRSVLCPSALVETVSLLAEG